MREEVETAPPPGREEECVDHDLNRERRVKFQRCGSDMPITRFAAVLVLFSTVAMGTVVEEAYSDIAEEDQTPQLDYQNPFWCHSVRLTNGEATCYSPRGGRYRSTLGTRCEMKCDRGYRLLGRSSIRCLQSRRWSGTAFCRKMRCRLLHLIPHGRYTCTRGFEVDSRCDFTCSPGYRFEGEHSRTCLSGGSWSGTQPVCTDMDPPRIKCPPSRLKAAEPGKLTAVVTWDPPVVSDTADKSLEVILVGEEPGTEFKAGPNIIRYKVYDQARNRAGCKFIVRIEVRRCPAMSAPLHGYVACTSDGNNYGATCDYRCDGGYELRGVSSRVCQFSGDWDGEPPRCEPLEIKADVKTLGALLDQFYEKRRLLILSAPDLSDPDYQLQNIVLQKSDCGLDLRRITLIELLGSPPQETGRIKESPLESDVIEGLRQAFRISRSYFSMVLLDERGADRERFITPMSSEELFAYTDDVLLDEEERERLELSRDFCD